MERSLTRFRPGLLVVLLAASCTPNAAHRLSRGGEALEVRVAPGELADPSRRAGLESSAVEIHDDYKLLFVEFDDQGQLYSTAPFLRLAETLQQEASAPPSTRLILVLFAHGWLNDARLCNRNVCCFRAFLSRIAADARMSTERSKGKIGPARVIGVFVGWRGLSATLPPFRTLSFYGRKNAAGAIGQGELVELLAFLDRYQKHVNAAAPKRCRLVILGHSFGGAMVFSAVANVLKGRIMDARVATMLSEANAPIEGFGDVVVLANPAFEASLYAPIYELTATFPLFSRRQSPLLVILASETDSSTRFFFKIGRWLQTIFQRTGPRSPRDMLVRTVGNYDPFVTHRATVAEDARASQPGTLRGVVRNCECTLPTSPVSAESVERLIRVLQIGPEEAAASLTPTLCPGQERIGVVNLDCVATRPPGLPFWVVRASDDVVSGHSGFFTRPVVDLVRELVSRRVLQEALTAPPPAAPEFGPGR